jgi:hypothetical protein
LDAGDLDERGVAALTKPTPYGDAPGRAAGDLGQSKHQRAAANTLHGADGAGADGDYAMGLRSLDMLEAIGAQAPAAYAAKRSVWAHAAAASAELNAAREGLLLDDPMAPDRMLTQSDELETASEMPVLFEPIIDHARHLLPNQEHLADRPGSSTRTGGDIDGL